MILTDAGYGRARISEPVDPELVTSIRFGQLSPESAEPGEYNPAACLDMKIASPFPVVEGSVNAVRKNRRELS
jgi:hypothetical protein